MTESTWLFIGGPLGIENMVQLEKHRPCFSFRQLASCNANTVGPIQWESNRDQTQRESNRESIPRSCEMPFDVSVANVSPVLEHMGQSAP
jgi:hypothetical protein